MLTPDQLYEIILKRPSIHGRLDICISELEESFDSIEPALVRLFKPGNLRYGSEVLDCFRPLDHYISAAVKSGQLDSNRYSKYFHILDNIVKLYPTLDTAAFYANMHPDTVSGLALNYFNSFDTYGLRILPISKILVVCQRSFDNLKTSTTNTTSELTKLACALCLFTPDTLVDDNLYRHTYIELARALKSYIFDYKEKFLPSEMMYMLAFESTLYDLVVDELESSTYYVATSTRYAKDFMSLPDGFDISKITAGNKLSYLETLYGDKFSPLFFQQLKLQHVLLGHDISLDVLKTVSNILDMNIPLEGVSLPEFTY